MKKTRQYTEIRKFQQDLNQCMKCGLCISWCPVYREEKKESSVARGKNRLVKALLTEELELSRGIAEHLNKCTLCGTCAANCPARSNIPDVIVAARADICSEQGIKFPFNIIYRWLLPRRKLFGNVVRAASWFQGIFMPKTNEKIRHLAFFLSAMGKGRQIPEIAPKFLREIVPVVNKSDADTNTGIKVGYFTGCMSEYVLPETGKKLIKFLNKHGVEVHVPQEQVCCGAPVFLGAGDFITGRKFADINTAAFKNFDYVITDCATCASAIKDYSKFLADNKDREENYSGFAVKIKDISEFLVDILKLPSSFYIANTEIKGKKVTWHDPCHLNRHLGIKEQPRKILKSLAGIEYVEMPDADKCCGMAGSFSLNYYDLSKQIADKKTDSIVAANADIVVTGCPGCEIQLIDQVTTKKLPVKVMHIIDILE